jgi:quercetin dioxygenase-like cupin family protein
MREAGGVDDVEHIDVTALLAPGADDRSRVRWSASNQLQTNVVVLPAGERVDEHVEPDLDVTLVVVAGEAQLRHGPPGQEVRTTARALSLVVLPAGTRRSWTAGPDGVAYVTAHRRRPSLLPRTRTPADRPPE